MTNYQEAIDNLSVLIEDTDTSRNFKIKAESAIKILRSNSALAIEKALLELEELNSSEISSYHRTQIWDIISLLESIKTSSLPKTYSSKIKN